MGRPRTCKIKLPDDAVERLTYVGRAMYGDDWRSPLAASLGVARSTVSRWLARTSETPADLDYRLANAAWRRQAELRDAAEEVWELKRSLQVIAHAPPPPPPPPLPPRVQSDEPAQTADAQAAVIELFERLAADAEEDQHVDA